ncbi:MAG: 2-C-methyl-D-erythritol 2,4-cyclodiphosphate synthase [Candidatus Eisenbacteria bacterium]
MLRVGIGYDIHRLTPGRKLVIGGVEIPFFRGLWGHSDGDVLIHAVIDAILGGCALGDIGRHFPDTDEQYRGIASTELLARVEEMIAEKCRVENIDSTIVAERPKLAPYIDAMRERIAEKLKIPIEKISIKAKTAEGVGPLGEGLAIEAHAVALVDV